MAVAHDQRLFLVKLLHTAVWVFFAGCVLAIPVLGWRGQLLEAGVLSGVVFLEVLVLVFNNWRCPLTPIAAQFTTDRRHNFDIFLPEWLARYNKEIFGTLYVAGLVYLLYLWLR
ncbi:MAG: hypothetical protein OER90_12865 [Gemmatimonadota bacterium]|nr:hypothetical protein [Gemmatimonadota bacterium]